MVVLMIITLTNEGKLQGDFVMITMMMILMIMKRNRQLDEYLFMTLIAPTSG